MKAKTLIIGYGNPLRRDDGLGWHAARLLREDRGPRTGDRGSGRPLQTVLNVCRIRVENRVGEVMACHQLTPELAEPISRAGLVIFIDAEERQPAGEIFSRRVTAEEAPPGALSHDFTPATLIALTRRLYQTCPEAILFSVSGRNFECGEELSPPVAAALPELIARVCKSAQAGKRTGEAGPDA